MLNIVNYRRNVNQNYNEVSPHTGQNGHRQNVNNKCLRGCGEDSPPVLLLEVCIGAGIMENSIEVSWETRKRPII